MIYCNHTISTRWISISIALILSTITGCSSDFLVKNDPQAVGFDHIKDLQSLTVASNGVYHYFAESDYYGRTFIVTPALFGDNAFMSVKNGGRYVNQDRITITTGDGNVTGAWSLMWKVIVNANLALTAADDLEFPEQQQPAVDQILGELHACRALAYFDMVRFFAQPYNFTSDASHLGVPLITTAQSDIIAPARSTVSEVYAQIVEDLKTAESLLDPQKKDGHFNRFGAQALLSKIYLYMEDWTNAEIYATKVIESGPYALLDQEDYVSSWASKFSIESIFEIGLTPTSNNFSLSIGYLTEQARYGEMLATKELYNAYSSTDIRRSMIEPGRRSGGESEAYFIKKYPLGSSTTDDNIKVLRLSELYLIRAEARAESAQTALALADLNAIAQRRDPEMTEINLSGTRLIDRILEERRKELAFEGTRLFDINRKKRDLVHIQSDQTRILTYPNEYFIMPIPYNEMNSNSNMVQNPGWK